MISRILTKLTSLIIPERGLPLQLHLTKTCNLRCKHCYHNELDHRGTDLTFHEWRGILDQCDALLKKLHRAPSFIFCGGEPLLSPIFEAIVEEIHARWPRATLSVTSNGTIWSPALGAFLKKHEIAVQISIDGQTPEEHDSIRGAGCFQSIMSTVTGLRSSEIKFHTLTVLSKRTSSQIDGVFALSRELGATSCSFRRLITMGRAENLVQSGVDEELKPLELKLAYESIWAAAKRHKIETCTDGALWALVDPTLGCHGGYGFRGIIIDSDGFLKVCGASDYRVADLSKTSLSDAFLKDSIFVSLRRGNIARCGGCKYYSRCGGDRSAAYSNSGDFLAPDPGCWLAF